MKNLKIGMALIAAVIAMSFTFASRNGALKTSHYTPGSSASSKCYEDFNVQLPDLTIENYATGDLSFVTNPTTAGCGVATSNVKVTNSGKTYFGDLLNSTDLTPVHSVGTEWTGTTGHNCDETLSVICCIHINPTTLAILDVCSGNRVIN